MTLCPANTYKPELPEGLPPGISFHVAFHTSTAAYRHMQVTMYEERTVWFGWRKKRVKIASESALARVKDSYDEHRNAVEAAMRSLFEQYGKDRALRYKYLYGWHP